MDLLTEFRELISTAPLDFMAAGGKAYENRTKELFFQKVNDFEHKLIDLLAEYGRYQAEEYDASQNHQNHHD